MWCLLVNVCVKGGCEEGWRLMMERGWLKGEGMKQDLNDV